MLKAIRRQSLNAPEGIVSVDDETQHTWRPVYVGQIRADGQFDLVWSSEKPVRPIPYPARDRMRNGMRFWTICTEAWGGWANPGPRGAARRAERCARFSSLLSESPPLRRSESGSTAGSTAMHYLFSFVQVRPAMTLRLGSLVLSRISISTQLVIWFLCISLIPCVVLTGIISLPLQPILEEDRASGAAGDLRCQDHPARDLHARAPWPT